MQLVLSIFTGIGMLDMAFKSEGFCVVSALDLILGHDIRDFKAVPNKFDGLIGGSPCQDFSNARRDPPTGNGVAMLNEFKRIVKETNVNWFLLENVTQVPDIAIEGYYVQRFNINALQCGLHQNRNRCFQFGSKAGYVLEVKRDKSPLEFSRCVTASDTERDFTEACTLQGLPVDFKLTEFHKAGANRAIGNGVPPPMGRKVALAIRETTEGKNARYITNTKICACGCGGILKGKQSYFNDACRARIYYNKKRVKARSLAT